MIIATTDGTYSYTRSQGSDGLGYAVKNLKLMNNKRSTSTLGFQPKVQTGQNRYECIVDIMDLEVNIRTSLLPMLEYPVDVDVTFDETIPLRNVTQLKMVISDYDIDKDFQEGADLRISLKLIEIVGI